MKRWSAVDVLINNAGITRDAQFVKWKDGAVAGTMTDDAFDSVISVNLKGVFLCSRAVVPHMIRKGSGVILNASSVVGLYRKFWSDKLCCHQGGSHRVCADVVARTGKIQYPCERRGSRFHRDRNGAEDAGEGCSDDGFTHPSRSHGKA